MSTIRATGFGDGVVAVLVAFDGAQFEPGSAYVSAFLLVLVDPTTHTTVQAQDVEQVELR